MGQAKISLRSNQVVIGMWLLKGCPRCRGDMELDRDEYGWYERCIQCGHLRDLPGAGVSPLVDGREGDKRGSLCPSYVSE